MQHVVSDHQISGHNATPSQNLTILLKQGLLDTPVLYLSRYINQNKSEYYRLLQDVRSNGSWQDWVLFMLDGVEQTAQQTTVLIYAIKKLMQEYKHQIREKLTGMYSQDLINNLHLVASL